MKSVQALCAHTSDKVFDTDIIEENFDVLMGLFTLPKVLALKHHIASILDGFQTASSDELTQLFQPSSLVCQVEVASNSLKLANNKAVELGLAKIAVSCNKKDADVNSALTSVSQVASACTETLDAFEDDDLSDLSVLAGATAREEANGHKRAEHLQYLLGKAADSDYQGVLKSFVFTKEWTKIRKAIESEIEEFKKRQGPFPLLKVVADRLAVGADFKQGLQPEEETTCKDSWQQVLLMLQSMDDAVPANQALNAILVTELDIIESAITQESQALQRFTACNTHTQKTHMFVLGYCSG